MNNNTAFGYVLNKVCPFCVAIADRDDSYAVTHQVVQEVKRYSGRFVSQEAFQIFYDMSRKKKVIECTPMTVSLSTRSTLECKEWRDVIRGDRLDDVTALERLSQMRYLFVKNMFSNINVVRERDLVLGGPEVVVYADYGRDFDDISHVYEAISNDEAMCYIGFLERPVTPQEFGRDGFTSFFSQCDDGVFYFVIREHICACYHTFYGENAMLKKGFFISENAYMEKLNQDLEKELVKISGAKEVTDDFGVSGGPKMEFMFADEAELIVVGAEELPIISYSEDVVKDCSLGQSIDLIVALLGKPELLVDRYAQELYDCVYSLRVLVPLMTRDQHSDYGGLLDALKGIYRCCKPGDTRSLIARLTTDSVYRTSYLSFIDVLTYYERVIFPNFRSTSFEYIIYHILVSTRLLKKKKECFSRISSLHNVVQCASNLLYVMQRKRTVFSLSVQSTFCAVLQDIYTYVARMVCEGDCFKEVRAEKIYKYTLELLSVVLLASSLAEIDQISLLASNGENFEAVVTKIYSGERDMSFVNYFLKIVVPIVSGEEGKLIGLADPYYGDKKNMRVGYCFLTLFKEKYWVEILVLNRFSPLLFASSAQRVKKFVKEEWFTDTVAVVSIKGKFYHLVSPSAETESYLKGKEFKIVRSIDYFLSII